MADLARAKQESREADERAQDSGDKSREDLRRENGLIVLPPEAPIDYSRSQLS
jgi:hypothetical protein